MPDDKIPFPDVGENKVDEDPALAKPIKGVKADKTDTSNTPDAPLKAPDPKLAPDEETVSAIANAAPHNEAAAAAVEAGMDVKIANEMTKVGSNI